MAACFKLNQRMQQLASNIDEAGNRSHRDDGVTGGDGEDVGAGDGLRAQSLHLRLDVVDDAEAPQRSSVRKRVLLPAVGVIQQNGRVAALQNMIINIIIDALICDGKKITWIDGLAWTKQSWKCSLSKEAPMRFSCATAAFTALLMVDSALGHDVS